MPSRLISEPSDIGFQKPEYEMFSKRIRIIIETIYWCLVGATIGGLYVFTIEMAHLLTGV